LRGNCCDAVSELVRDSGGESGLCGLPWCEREGRFWGTGILALALAIPVPLGLVGVAGLGLAIWGRSGERAGGAAGNGSKGSKAPNDWIESPLGLGTKLRGRELRRDDSVSLSPPYRSPIASVTWWLSSLIEICGT
jgi:hypothetical protein